MYRDAVEDSAAPQGTGHVLRLRSQFSEKKNSKAQQSASPEF